MTATTTNNAANNINTIFTKAEYFNFEIKGLGCLSNIYRIKTLNNGVVINALGNSTDNPTDVFFDATVAGKEATDLISRCKKAVTMTRRCCLGLPSAT